MTPVAADLVWPEVAAARERLAGLLDGLDPGDWDRPTPCDRWTVREVVAHVLAMATVRPAAAIATYLRRGADLDLANDALVARTLRTCSDTELVALLRARSTSQHRPPGLRPVGVLAEVVVHSFDVAVAVGRAIDESPVALDWTLEYLATRVPGNTRFHVRGGRKVAVLDGARRAEGLRLVATDTGWVRGPSERPAVEGPAAWLVLALAGRSTGLERLQGPGVDRLRTTWSG